MKAVIKKREGLRVEQVPKPKQVEGEALVKVLKAGICNTDLELIDGYMDFEGVLGHEFVGIVVQSPDEAWTGKRVVGDINIPCRSCETCLTIDPKHCPSRKVLGIHQKDGAFAEYVTLPLVNLYVVPSAVSDEEAVFTEPLASALEILEQIVIDEKQEILVLGDGKLGLLIAFVLQKKSPHVICVGHHPRKLAFLKRRGIETFHDFDKLERKFDVVVEATGSPQGMRVAMNKAKPRGKIIAKSTFHGIFDINLSSLVVDEIQLIGSRCGPFDKTIEFLQIEDLELEEMVDADFPLEKALEAFEKAREPEVLKVLLTP